MRLPIHFVFRLAVLLLSIAVCSVVRGQAVDFNRDVRPILSDTCFKCHGPDAAQRVSDLRLDQRASVFGLLESGDRAVVAGDTDASQLVVRIHAEDDDLRMPPLDADRQLTDQQRSLLTRWVEQGARWQEHWSFLPPRRPAPRHATNPWYRNPIDGFVLDALQDQPLSVTSEASKRTLIRRLSLDLIGLPPTKQQVREFLADESPEAYETLVDRLLNSPHYGERMALMWLDAARYADTSGYQNDGPRSMWRWRDWVIAAFNENKRFDQFTIEQLAGDLLPNATLDQKIATGFNRNHRGNAEGGIIPEEYQVEYVVDRVEVTSTVWLGLTMGCARCHDHKYDPLGQRDFYGLFAFFNQVPESGRAIKEGNSPPYLTAPTRDQRQQLQQLQDESRQLEEQWEAIAASLKTDFRQWRESDATVDAEWNVDEGLVFSATFDEGSQQPEEEFTSAVGKIGRSLDVAGEAHSFGDFGDFGYFDAFTLAAWVKPRQATGTVLSRMVPVDQGSGYYVHLENGHVQVNLVKRWLDDSIRVESVAAIPLNQWTHLAVTYDGSRVAAGIKIYINGQRVEQRVHLDGLNQSFETTEPLRAGGGHRDFFGQLDDVRVYDRPLTAREAAWLAEPLSVAQLKQRSEPLSARQTSKLQQYYHLFVARPEFRDVVWRRRSNLAAIEAFRATLPTVMVMHDSPGLRETYMLKRGQYDQPYGEPLQPQTPAALPPLPDAFPQNRLGLARWLVHPDNPLTARVFVNRLWQMHFGAGLVGTPEDFGVQGARPTHPELLDWLAVEFMESGWDIKHLHKVIVMSATYRQHSGWTEAASRDPDNSWLARGPRVRLDAELIRDQALALGGLLNERIGGPSVKPYQPSGLWKEIATVTDYQQSTGDDLYRRSLYTYWKRTVPPPTMVAFDATSREACTVQRSRTNTPLQALALMNDVTFVEAARGLAQEVLAEQPVAGESAAAELLVAGVFERATARPPSMAEAAVLTRSYRRSLREYQQSPELAERWLRHGQLKVPLQFDTAELAALSTVASMVLNLDEVITRE